MPRRSHVLLTVLCLGASIAHADGMLPDGSTLTFNKLLLHEDNSEAPAELQKDPDSIWNYFNLAHCVCSFFNYNPDSEDPAFFEDTFAYEITIQNSTTALNRPIEFWVGTDCANTDSAIRDTNCTAVGTLDVSAIQQSGVGTIDISVYDLMVPKPGERPGCQERLQASTTWGLVDADADSTFEYSISDQIETDTEPPPLPTDFEAVGAEEAINLTWEPPAEGVADIAYYQALCATTEGGSAAKSSPSSSPRYQTARQLCGAAQDIVLSPSDISTNTSPDAGTGSITLPEELAGLSPSYVCGESTSSTATSMRIDGLKNGVGYTVVMLAIDKYGNASGTYFTSSLVPQPATDFWEDLHDRGSGVEGGFCLIAQAYGDNNPLTQTLRNFRDETLATSSYGRWLIDVYYATIGSLNLHGSTLLGALVALVMLPLVALALLWHLLTLPGLFALGVLAYAMRRRRLRWVSPRWAAAAMTLAVIALAPTQAHAQTPYWEDTAVPSDTGDLALDDPRRVKWHAGVRVGPYVPGIDAQLDMPIGKYAGPYEQMFGGYSILPMLDIERFLVYAYGQLGAGISIGYLGKKAHPWEAGSDPNDASRPRSQGDENTFRLFPFSLNATYRLTYLDDEFGIPLVPYARAGIAYYVWWVDAPNGDFAKSCVDGGTDAMCKTTDARGASLGLVGSIGLAIRAERIDSAAARSMKESGIEHAGFYAEYSLGKVDGFGSEKKLSLGDATWFAGVDFEF